MGGRVVSFFGVHIFYHHQSPAIYKYNTGIGICDPKKAAAVLRAGDDVSVEKNPVRGLLVQQAEYRTALPAVYAKNFCLMLLPPPFPRPREE